MTIRLISEARVLSEVRLRAPALGWTLWRNNVGACTDMTGRLIRYGLANDSAQLNAAFKSGDLIGWRPVLVTPEMVGQTLAQFVSVECKAPAGRVLPAQRAWADLITKAGGHALVVHSEGELG